MLVRCRTFGGGNMQQMAYELVRCDAWDKLTCIGNLIPRIISWCDSVFFVWAKRRFPMEIDRQLIGCVVSA